MCSTYYLSLPKGTLFAFTINEEATLAHLNGQDVDEARKSLSANLRRLKKDIKYIGYVTKITPDNIELVILASQPNAAAPLFTSEYPPAASYNTRQGVAVYTSKKAHPSGVQRTRTKSHIGSTESSGNMNLLPMPMMRSNCQHALPPGLYSTLVSAESTLLRPSAALPWPQAYAYRPTLKNSHMHRFVVHSFSAHGAKRPGVRLPRLEAERSEHIMDGLRAEEEEKWKENERTSCTFNRFEQLGLNVEAASSHSNSLDIANVSGPQQQATLTAYADMDADDTLAHPYGLPIYIDVFLDITKVKQLPLSPEDFEAQIEKMEELERLCRRKFAQRMDQWRASVDSDGWKEDEGTCVNRS